MDDKLFKPRRIEDRELILQEKINSLKFLLKVLGIKNRIRKIYKDHYSFELTLDIEHENSIEFLTLVVGPKTAKELVNSKVNKFLL